LRVEREPFTVMGPGFRRGRHGRRRDNDGYRRDTTTRFTKPGEVPVFNDHMNPKKYRRSVMLYLRYNELALDGSSKKLSKAQQLVTLIQNVHGSAHHRLAYMPGMIHKDITDDEFVDLIDDMLNILDPLDGQSSFLETANALRDVVHKTHSDKESFDQYWLKYASLVSTYEYNYGKGGQSKESKELTAYMCVINSRLSRTEFTAVLKDAEEIQREINTKDGRRLVEGHTGPVSARDVLSTTSATRRVPLPADNFVTSMTIEDDSSNIGNASNAKELIAQQKGELDDALRLADGIQKLVHDTIGDMVENMESEERIDKLKEARTKSTLVLRTIGDIVEISEKIGATQKRNPTQVHARRSTTHDTQELPRITMESVRIAFRRLDFGERLSHVGPDKPSQSVPTYTAITEGKGPCWVCKGSHFAFQNPKCKAELAKRRKAENERARGNSQDAANSQSRDHVMTGVSWGETSIIHSKVTLMSLKSFSDLESLTAIIDGGASASGVGWDVYLNICDVIGTKPIILPLNKGDSRYHAFGTPNNCSELQKIVGRSTIPLPLGNGKWAPISALVVQGKVPFIIGKDTLQKFKCVEDHDKGRLEIRAGNHGISLRTFMSGEDGHARIAFNALSVRENIVESLIWDARNSNSPRELVRKIHARTHVHKTTIEKLLRRAGQWNRDAADELNSLTKGCKICLKSGEPKVMAKFSLSKLNREFNDCLQMDIMYWGKRMALHLVDAATGYSEVTSLSSRSLEAVLRVLENTWNLRHGCPAEIRGDQEFDKGVLKKWMLNRGIKFVPLAARRHNKAAIVERKNRVIKDSLEKIDQDKAYSRKVFADKLCLAQYTSNILYGNKELSAFEMVRGYTPSVEGSGQAFLPESVIDAHKAMEARRLIARMLKSKPNWKPDMEIKAGDLVLALIPGGKRPRGQWKEFEVAEVKDEHSVVVGKGRNARVIAMEDIRKLPDNELAGNVMRTQHGIWKRTTFISNPR